MSDKHPVRMGLANATAFAFVILMNALANAVPLNGQTTGELSAKYPSLFTPAGFTFGIWGLIYLTLLGFIVYQLLPAARERELLARITPWFLVSCAANACWILAWHWEWVGLSLLLMLSLLAALLAIFRHVNSTGGMTVAQWLFVYLPFSIYCGWISVATIANVSALQTDWGWNDLLLSATHWTWLKLAIAGLAAAWVALRGRNAPYVLVVAWAAYGIYRGQLESPAVAGAAGMLMILALLLALSIAVGSRTPDRS